MTNSTPIRRFSEQQYINQFWAGKLIECKQKMGEQHTNVVLLSLGGEQKIKPYQHYPKSSFSFANGNWKVFYHCHQSPGETRQEHGHFHYFTRLDPQGKAANSGADLDLNQWSHVIGVGMNELGQPTRLFTTNLWVTDGEWFEPDFVHDQFDKIRDNEETDLSKAWFKYLLLIFEDEITQLLLQRDHLVNQYYPEDHEQCFTDRSIYYLSNLDINLNEKLIEVFQPVHQENY